MGRSIRRRIQRAPGRAGLSAVAAAVALGVALTGSPASLAAQQDPAPQDTISQDTIPQDTVAADTALTTRERALQRLRAMPVDPVEPDTLAADTAGAAMEAPDAPDPPDAPSDTVDGAAPADTIARPQRELPPAPGQVLEPSDTVVLFVDDTVPDPGVVAADSVRTLLRSLGGYTLTEYTGDTAAVAVFRAETGELELTGQTRVGQGQNALETDSLLVYDRESGVVCGYGTPVLSGEQDPIESDELCFNIERNLGVAVGARTTFQQGATWYVRGADNRIYLLTGGERNALYGQRAQFTSCDLDHPHYTFRAGSLKMVEDDMMVARNITLEFEDVPVFWLPWMVQSMKRDRRSGLLMPEFGLNDIVRNSSGYNRSISNLGFYWAINDYTSAKGTFEWYSDNWTAVEGAVTYRWLRQFLRGNLTAKQYWRQQEGSVGRREMTINTSNSWQPDERTRIRVNGNYATSTEFVRDNSFDPRELNRRITSTASVNRSFDWGSVSLGADRNEQLSTGQIDWKLPGLSLNISPVTLYQGDDGLNVTWNGSGSTTRRTRHVPDTLGIRDTHSLDANYSHSLSLGKLGLSQNLSWQEETQQGPVAPGALPPAPGGLPGGIGRVAGNVGGTGFRLGEEAAEQLGWSTSLSYQQVLWAGTTLNPNVSITGNRVRNEDTSDEFLAEPNRISAGASLNTSIYGFWPGFGNFSRIRHKIAPNLRWSYSPAPDVSPLQEEVFGLRNLREQNRLTVSFNQTFEAKVREDDPEDAADADAGAGAAGDDEADAVAEAADGTDAADGQPGPDAATAAGAAAAAGAVQGGEPRRLPQAEKVMLLALDTRTSFVYDFVSAAEEGRGFLTDEISNSIRSDLLEGFQLTMTHSLFETGQTDDPDALAPRRFDPFLTNLSASFSIDDDFWLFDFLGLTSTSDPAAGPGRDAAEDEDPGAEGADASADPDVGAEADPDRSPGMGSIIGGQGPEASGVMRGVGGWRAALNYSFRRNRPTIDRPDTNENQLLSGNVSFQPTQHWSLRWSTAYSITDREFANHVLTLSRDLHRWQANFDFVKAQNGNFLFSFRVQLRDNPDLKLDYDQREGPAERGAGGLRPPAQ